jgi:glutathione peroxidase
MRRILTVLLSCIAVVFHSAGVSSAVDTVDVVVDPDTNPSCAEWAERGECSRNTGYMLANCATSCAAVAAAEAAEAAELQGIESFFDLSAPDIDGNVIKFEQFRGQVTILTNVASYCGYTESHYTGLVELWSQLSGENVNILAFPCNQFGEQEPGTAAEIKAFAAEKGVKFTMMQKINVNGPDASTVYKYIKHETGVDFIKWNFATYFVIAPDGSLTQHSGVEPLELKGFALSLLKEEL